MEEKTGFQFSVFSGKLRALTQLAVGDAQRPTPNAQSPTRPLTTLNTRTQHFVSPVVQNSHEDSGHQVTPADFSEYCRELPGELLIVDALPRRAGDVNPLIEFLSTPELRVLSSIHVLQSRVRILPCDESKSSRNTLR